MSSKLVQLKEFYGNNPDKWCKGSRGEYDDATSHCILGAMDRCYINTDRPENDLDAMAIFEEFPFDSAFEAQYPYYTHSWKLAQWNNAPERKFEDILGLIDRAIARRNSVKDEKVPM